MSYLLLFHGNCGYANLPLYYVIHTLAVLVFVLDITGRQTDEKECEADRCVGGQCVCGYADAYKCKLF